MRSLGSRDDLAREVLDALTANIAVLDASGVIVAVNDSWIAFARENGAPDPYVGSNYLEVCERALASGEGGAPLADVLNHLRDLLAGHGDGLAIEYPCHSPTEKRWFLLRAVPLHEAGRGVVVAHENITARKRAEESLVETERTLRAVLEALPVGVWMMDRTGRIVNGNPAGIRIWAGARYVGPESYGDYKAWWLSTGKLITPDEWAAARAIRNGETSIGEEIEIECFDGTHKIILNSAIPLRGDDGTIDGAIIVNQDITERKSDEEALRRAKENLEAATRELAEALGRERILARVDLLTGAMTRRHFFELAAHEISVAARYRDPLSLLLFDVDDLKRTNDTLGHQTGDELLQRVARTAREHLRESDLFGRYGGDEFVILLPHTRPADAEIVAERMRAGFAAQTILTRDGILTVTISIGIAELSGREDTLEALVHRADLALYASKKSGRNRISVFGAEPR